MKYFNLLCIFIYAGLFLLLSQLVHWSDSELWAIGLARETFSLVNPSVDYKILFNALLRSVYTFSFTNLQVVEHSRLVFAGLGLILLYLIRRISSSLTEKKSADIFGFLLLGTSTLFLSQGFKVRSDLLACVIQFIGVLYFLGLNARATDLESLKTKDILLGIALNFMVLLATPKGVYNLFVNFTFISALYYQVKAPWIRHYLRMTFMVPGLCFLLLALTRLREFKSAFDFFIRSYAASPQHPAFWEWHSFAFVADSVVRNLPVLLLGIFGYFKLRKTSQNKFLPSLVAASCASVLVILVHNDRLPFFILGHFIFPVLLATAVLVELKSKWLKAAVLAAGAISGGIFVSKMIAEAPNKIQIQTQAKIHDYLAKYRQPLYYDGTSVLPLDNRILTFPAPQHLGNEAEVLEILTRKDLSLVFLGNRLYYYFQPFFLGLEENFFISIGPGVFAKSYVMRGNHTLELAEWRDVCNRSGAYEKMFVYEGQSFLTMKLATSSPVLCSEPPKRFETSQPFIAFSPFEPLQFKDELSFSNIFDHKPFY